MLTLLSHPSGRTFSMFQPPVSFPASTIVTPSLGHYIGWRLFHRYYQLPFRNHYGPHSTYQASPFVSSRIPSRSLRLAPQNVLSPSLYNNPPTRAACCLPKHRTLHSTHAHWFPATPRHPPPAMPRSPNCSIPPTRDVREAP